MVTANHKQLAPERWEQLRAIVRHRRVVRIEDLCRELAASPATVRRDLEQLVKQGLVQRVHGGVVNVENRMDEPLFDAKASIATGEKQRIARAALALVEPTDTIFLDGGSTVLELARLLHDYPQVTVVTNSLRAAQELAGRGPRLILTGGELRRLSQTMVGPLTRWLLQEVHLDKAFMGTIGISEREGLTTTDPSEAFTKELVMQQARQVIVLADSAKAGKVAFARAGSLDNVDVIITDAKVNRKFSQEMTKRKIKLVRA